MRFSRAGAVLAAAVVAALLIQAGCAQTPRSRPRPVPEAEVPPADPDVTREDEPPPGAGAADPSEEITPEELATIPDPVPGTDAPPETPSEGTERPGRGMGTPDTDSRSTAPSEAVWRVQIFASEDLPEAERVARRAGALLGTSATVHFDRPLYKVRLGAFATEAEAQSLRERAVRAGYPGAFRIRTRRG